MQLAFHCNKPARGNSVAHFLQWFVAIALDYKPSVCNYRPLQLIATIVIRCNQIAFASRVLKLDLFSVLECNLIQFQLLSQRSRFLFRMFLLSHPLLWQQKEDSGLAFSDVLTKQNLIKSKSLSSKLLDLKLHESYWKREQPLKMRSLVYFVVPFKYLSTLVDLFGGVFV